MITYHAVPGAARRPRFSGPKPSFVACGTLYAHEEGGATWEVDYHAYRLRGKSGKPDAFLVTFPADPRGSATCAHESEIAQTAAASWSKLHHPTPAPLLAEERPLITQEALDGSLTAASFGAWLANLPPERRFVAIDGAHCFGHGFLVERTGLPADRISCGTVLVYLYDRGWKKGKLTINDVMIRTFLARAMELGETTAHAGLLLWIDVLADAACGGAR